MSRILVIDDESDVRGAITASLEDAGHTVLQGTDGSESVSLAKEHGPDLIFLDLMMPQLDGFDALALLKADPHTRDIPVVVVSAKGRPEDRLRARAMGAIDYINKPWGPGELVLRAQMAITAAARKRAAPTLTPPPPPPPPASRPPVQVKIVRSPYARPVVRLAQPQPGHQLAPPRPQQAVPVYRQARPATPSPQAAPAADQIRLAAGRFIVQHEYSVKQAPSVSRSFSSKSGVILRPVEDPDWVVRFDTFDSAEQARMAPGVTNRYIFGIRGASTASAMYAIFSEWELTDPDRALRFEANRSILFEMHRRHITGLISEWLMKRHDETPHYTVLAMFGDQDSAVRFRSFTPPAQFSSAQVQKAFNASELFGMCACHVRKAA